MGLVNARVLITGINGFIGANLAARLLAEGADVHGMIREGSDLWRLTGILPRISLHRADLTDGSALAEAVRSAMPQVVFHLAAARRSSTPSDRAATLAANVAGTLSLVEAASSNGCQRFVQAGSSLEYGPRDYPTRESDPPAPQSFFGTSKAWATLLARGVARDHGLPLTCLRVYSVYGYWEGAGRLVPTVIRAAMGTGEVALTASGYRRDFVFVEDVVDAFLVAALCDEAAGQILNIGSGVQSTNEQVVDLIESIAGRKLVRRVGAYPPHETDTQFWVADNRQARQVLGWQPVHSLLRGLEKTWAWMERHRADYDRFAVALRPEGPGDA